MNTQDLERRIDDLSDTLDTYLSEIHKRIDDNETKIDDIRIDIKNMEAKLKKLKRHSRDGK